MTGIWNNRMGEPLDVMLFSDSAAVLAAARQSAGEMPDIVITEAGPCTVRSPDQIRARRPWLVIIDAGSGRDESLMLLHTIQAGNVSMAWPRPIHILLISNLAPAVATILADSMELGHFEHVYWCYPDTAPEVRSLAMALGAKVAAFMNQQGLQRSPRARPAMRQPALRSVRSGQPAAAEPQPTTKVLRSPRIRAEAIVIGCSTGGPQALANLLPDLCRLTRAPIFVVQHINNAFITSLAEALMAKCERPVTVAAHGTIPEPGHVYLSPGERHLALKDDNGHIQMIISDTAPEAGCKPSANVLFRSAAAAYGPRVVGVILTGMGSDGTEGAAALKKAGARVFAQDEASSVVWGMPGHAVGKGYVDEVHPLDDMAAALSRCLRHEGDAP